MNNQPSRSRRTRKADQPKTGRSLIIGTVVLIALVGGVVLWNQKSKQKTAQSEQQITKQNKKEKAQEKIVKALKGDFSDDKKYKAPKKRKVIRVEGIKNIMELVDGEYKFDKVDTSNWKTYRNEDIGIEMKIPSDWVCTEDKVTKLIAVDKKYSRVCLAKNALKNKNIYKAINESDTFFIYVDKDPVLDFNVKWDILDYTDSDKNTKLYIANIDNAKKLLSINKKHIIIKTDIKSEEFTFRLDRKTNKSKQIFDGIMQTLKFIN